MKKLTLTLAALFASSAVFAAPITPVSYTFDQATACGTWCYHDAGLTKLTDGVVGNAGWAVNAGQEWDGWVYQPVVNIDFNFGSVVGIDSVAIGSTQDNLYDVALPSFTVSQWSGSNWVAVGSIINPASSANDHSPYDTSAHNFYTLSNLGISSQYVRVTALANGPWTFVDEVKFTTAVPEPETYALMGLGLVALIARRRQQKRSV